MEEKQIIAISGSTGFIGKHLKAEWTKQIILPVTRYDLELPDEKFIEKFSRADVIINLAGASVIKRWTEDYKKEISESRIKTTKKLVKLIKSEESKRRHFI